AEERIEGTAGRVEDALHAEVLLPQVERLQVLIVALRDVVGLIVCVADFEQPALELVLQVRAVLPRVEAARILNVPRHARTEIGERTERRTRRRENAAAERIVERVERRDVVVGGLRQTGAAA